ncbi:BfmA/BtgA family mobilization protein [Salegentibacter maritimus]|uniref:BfmA/BtgA family mobilization protein n=1 Tax=Salegentibacter maritimus TaxID=2794347 RepID=UPI00293D7964|nr:BfmA/BtgA family mobilization protein [Salegentibacter maritimus]
MDEKYKKEKFETLKIKTSVAKKFRRFSRALSKSQSMTLLSMVDFGYFGVMVPPVSVKQCHFERYCNYIKN